MIIQKVSKGKAVKFCHDVQDFEKSILQEAGIYDEAMQSGLFFNKDVRAAVQMKSLKHDSYSYLVRWAKENFSGLKELSHDEQIKNCREFLVKNQI